MTLIIFYFSVHWSLLLVTISLVFILYKLREESHQAPPLNSRPISIGQNFHWSTLGYYVTIKLWRVWGRSFYLPATCFRRVFKKITSVNRHKFPNLIWRKPILYCLHVCLKICVDCWFCLALLSLVSCHLRNTTRIHLKVLDKLVRRLDFKDFSS